MFLKRLSARINWHFRNFANVRLAVFVEDSGYKLVATLVESAVNVKAENLLEGRENRSEVVPEVIQSVSFRYSDRRYPVFEPHTQAPTPQFAPAERRSSLYTRVDTRAERSRRRGKHATKSLSFIARLRCNV